MKALLIVVLFITGLPSTLWGQTLKTTSTKSRIWVLEAEVLKHLLIGDQDHGIRGLGSKVSFGYGIAKQHSFAYINADLFIGPFDVPYKNIKSDYWGSGLHLKIGNSIKGLQLRGTSNSLGAYAGISYQELGSESYPSFKIPTSENEQKQISYYKNHIQKLDVLFGLFLGKIAAQRPDSLKPVDLETRHGLMIYLGVSLPVYANYSAKIKTHTQSEQEILTGTLSGPSISLALSSWLET